MYNILICDDELDIVRALKIYLTDPGYTFFEAHNGQEALEIVSNEEIHLILMDVMMPVMDGLEATRRIRALEDPAIAAVPVIAMTANAFESDVKEALDAGMNAHIPKPFTVEEMLSVIGRFV